eukprot:341439_1
MNKRERNRKNNKSLTSYSMTELISECEFSNVKRIIFNWMDSIWTSEPRRQVVHVTDMKTNDVLNIIWHFENEKLLLHIKVIYMNHNEKILEMKYHLLFLLNSSSPAVYH